MALISQNPATGAVIAKYKEVSAREVAQVLQSMMKPFQSWKLLNPSQRLERLKVVFDRLRQRQDELAQTIVLEMGKPISQAYAEIQKSLSLYPYYRTEIGRLFAVTQIALDAGLKADVVHRPLGIVLGIMPWNFPVWQPMRFAIPTLLAGNLIVLKHAPSVQGVAEILDWAFKPLNVYANLPISVSKVKGVIESPRIVGVSLTGSARAGREVASIAGRALKKAVLELGGSDPAIVMDDADIEASAKICVEARLLNAGQSCISPKRFIVTKARAKAFEEAVVSSLAHYMFGDPMQSDCRLGPLAREDLRAALHRQVLRARSKGAKLRMGGTIPKGSGFYYPASLLTQFPGDYDEELFGPVACILVARDEREALRIANQSSYGLGGAIFGKDIDRIRFLAENELDVGMVALNTFVRSDSRIPFGGVKASGYGRELGIYGPYEFTNTKVVLNS